MNITIGFSKHKGFAPLSWLIMLCEGTPFSHAYIKVHSASLDRNIIYQATGAGVNFVGEQLFDQSAQVVYEFKIPLEKASHNKLLQWAVDNAGKPYGHMQMVGLGLVRLAKLLGLRIKNPFPNGTGSYVCCELVAAALEDVGIPGPSDLDLVDLNSALQMVKAAEEKGKT